MNKILFISFITCMLLTFDVKSQELIGRYSNVKNYEYLNFKSKNEVEFDLNNGGCLVSRYKMTGKYKIINNHIFIKPIRPINLPNAIEKKCNKNITDSVISFDVFDINGPVKGVSISLTSCKKPIWTNTDSVGHAKLITKDDIKDMILKVSYIGYSIVSEIIADNVKCDYKIHLEPDPDFHDSQIFLDNNGTGFEFKIDHDVLLLKRLKPYCDQKDSCYEWREYKK